VVSGPSFRQNVIVKMLLFPWSYNCDDDYDNDCYDDDLLMMMSSYMQSDDVIDDECMYEKWRC
jgi:hypothetical protein